MKARYKSPFKSFPFLFLMLSLVLSVWLRPVSASSLVSSRINQLEFQVRSLQTQVNQLSNQPNVRPSLTSVPVVGSNDSVSIDSTADPTFNQQFDNLATLVIEINQRVMAIEQQLTEEES